MRIGLPWLDASTGTRAAGVPSKDVPSKDAPSKVAPSKAVPPTDLHFGARPARKV